MKFYHQINSNGFGGITLCYELIEHPHGKALAISFAQCSKKDQYRKATGRSLAAKRMMEGDMFAITVKGSKTNIKQRIYNYLYILAYELNELQG